MAKIKSPFGSSEIRGSIGGLTYARSASGLYVRAKGTVLPKRTEDQMTMRVALQACVTEFLTMSKEEIDEWIEFARMNPVKFATASMMRLCAITWFKRVNVHRRILRYPWIKKPPPGPKGTYRGRFSMKRVAGDIVGDVDPHPLGERFVYFSSGMRRPWTRNVTPEKWHKVGYGTSTSPPPKIMQEVGPTGTYMGRAFGRVRLYDEYGRTGPWAYRFLDYSTNKK